MNLYLLVLLFLHGPGWQLDFEKARQEANDKHKLILVNFSGSDWCGPCIRMETEIFDKENFKEFAEGKLVLVNADFPRLKKHALSAEQQKRNDQLADKYNPKGIFPFTLLIKPDGTVLKSWEGLPPESSDEFIKDIRSNAGSSN